MKKRLQDIAKNNTPDLTDEIKNSQTYQTFIASAHQKKTQKPLLSPLRFAYAGIFSLVVILMVFLTPALNQPVYSEVYIEFNPSFTLNLSDDDTVRNLQGLNDDGETLINATGHLDGETLDDALNQLIDQAIELGLITDDQTLMYDVITDDDTLRDHHRDMVSHLLEDIKNQKLPSMNVMAAVGGMPSESERAISEDYDIGIMHARLIGLILLERDDLTIDDLIDLNMMDLRALLNDDDDAFPGNNRPRHPFDDGEFPGNRPPARGPMH